MTGNDSSTDTNHSWIRFLPSFIRNRIYGHPIRQKIIGNTWWLFIDRIIRMGVSLLVGIWLARYLGPEKFGILSYAFAFVALFSALATLGLNSVVIRDIVKCPESANEILGTAFVLKLAGGLIVLMLTVYIVSIMRPSDLLTQWMVGIIAAGTIFQAFDAIDFWFQSQIKSKYTVYAKNSAFLLANIGKICLILVKAPLIAFAWVALAEVAMGAAGLFYVYRIKGYVLKHWYSSMGRAKQLLKDSWPLILSGIVIIIYMRIDQIMLREMLGDSAVGVYSAAVTLCEAGYFIPIIIASSVFPSIIETKKVSEALYHNRLQSLYSFNTWLALLIAIPTTLLADHIIYIIYGGQYLQAAGVLKIYIWTNLFVFFGTIKGNWVITENQQIYNIIFQSVGAIINVALNLIMIPKYGGTGAAYATLVTVVNNTLVAPLFINAKQRNQTFMFIKSFNPNYILKEG